MPPFMKVVYTVNTSYPVDSFIQPFNNLGQEMDIECTVGDSHSFFSPSISIINHHYGLETKKIIKNETRLESLIF